MVVFAVWLLAWLSAPLGRASVLPPAPARASCPDGPLNERRVDTGRQLRDLRALMSSGHVEFNMPIDAYIVTSHDDHQSETTAAPDRRREYLTGFTGSSGLAIVTQEEAALWTDGRYHAQAEMQLSCQWQLMRHGEAGVPSPAAWLADVLSPGDRVGADARLLPNHTWHAFEDQLANVNIKMLSIPENLIDKIWLNRPNYKSLAAYVHKLEYAGESWESKVHRLRQKLVELKVDAMVVTALDEIAWLLNIRGRDVPHNPVVRSYVIITNNELHLYIDQGKLSPEIKRHLRTEKCYHDKCVKAHRYNEIFDDLKSYNPFWNRVLFPSQCVYSEGASHAIYSTVSPLEKRVSMPSPIIFMKAKKNSVEIRGMRKAHIRDAAALCDFMAYFEEKMDYGYEWTEVNASKVLNQFRREQDHSEGPSFAPIVAFGPNGALPHYQPSFATDTKINDSSTLVIDSGGQYYDGTTDVTRTFHFGTPTEFQQEVYTRVLMGMIQLSMLVFPDDLQTSNIDVLARGPLWQAGLDYQHGTGHGIGAFLNVHESPINIFYRVGNETFEGGHFFSNEPGYYHDGHFGVRLENILEVEERKPLYYGGKPYLGFRPVTLVPFEPKLINVKMLTHEHRHWLNEYNAEIRINVGAELKHQKRTKGFHWMMSKTGYIPEYCIVRSSGYRTFENIFSIKYSFLILFVVIELT